MGHILSLSLSLGCVAISLFLDTSGEIQKKIIAKHISLHTSPSISPCDLTPNLVSSCLPKKNTLSLSLLVPLAFSVLITIILPHPRIIIVIIILFNRKHFFFSDLIIFFTSISILKKKLSLSLSLPLISHSSILHRYYFCLYKEKKLTSLKT